MEAAIRGRFLLCGRPLVYLRCVGLCFGCRCETLGTGGTLVPLCAGGEKYG
jgi:hypothetical protein